MVAWIVFVSIVTPGVLSMMGWFFVRLLKSVDERFEQFDKRFDQVDRSIELVDKRFDQVDRSIEQVDRRFDQVDNRFEQVDNRFQQVDKRLEKHEEQFVFLLNETVEIRKDIANLSLDHGRLELKLEGFIATVQPEPSPQTEKAA